MTVNEVCPICQGRCCEYGLEDYRGASRRGAHRSEAIHTCPYCTNGTKPLVWTVEQERAADPAFFLVAEVKRLKEENRKLRDVLEWVNTQCSGKCAGVCDAALRGEHRREEAT